MTSLGIKALSQMVAEVGRLVEDTSEARQPAIKDALNNAMMEIASIREWDQLLETDETGLRQGGGSLSTLLSGEAEFPLPWNCMRLKSAHFTDNTFSPIKVVGANELYEGAGSYLQTQSAPRIACTIGRTAQYRKYTQETDEVLTFTSNLSNANKTLRVHYEPFTMFTGGDHWKNITSVDWVATPGDSPTGVRPGWPLRRISIPVGWIGSVSVTDVDDVEIAEVPSVEISQSVANDNYQVADRLLMRCWPVPDADYAMSLVYWRKPVRLTEDEDTPQIPVSDFMVYKAAATIMRTMGDGAKAQGYDAEAQASLTAASTGHTSHGRLVMRGPRGGILGMTGTTYWGARW